MCLSELWKETYLQRTVDDEVINDLTDSLTVTMTLSL